MEYCSFLFEMIGVMQEDIKISFCLLMEYHSFLCKDCKFTVKMTLAEFPSPYGVSFILTI